MSSEKIKFFKKLSRRYVLFSAEQRGMRKKVSKRTESGKSQEALAAF
jgi:hypothetical protein